MSIKTSNKVLPDLSKLELQDGINYCQWSKKVLIFFEQLKVDYVLTTDPLSDPLVTILAPTSNLESSTSPPAIVIDQVKQVSTTDLEKYAKDKKTIWGHLLNHKPNLMFDLFMVKKFSKDIWRILESQYGGDDANRKRYVVLEFMS